jgi:hypothetical protein
MENRTSSALDYGRRSAYSPVSLGRQRVFTLGRLRRGHSPRHCRGRGGKPRPGSTPRRGRTTSAQYAEQAAGARLPAAGTAALKSCELPPAGARLPAAGTAVLKSCELPPAESAGRVSVVVLRDVCCLGRRQGQYPSSVLIRKTRLRPKGGLTRIFCGMRSPCGMARQANYLLEQMYFILGMVSRDRTLKCVRQSFGEDERQIAL